MSKNRSGCESGTWTGGLTLAATGGVSVYGFVVYAGTAAGSLQIYDQISTSTAVLLKMQPYVAANLTYSEMFPTPIQFTSGLVYSFSGDTLGAATVLYAKNSV